MHYPDQQCHLLAMPKTASLRELEEKEGIPCPSPEGAKHSSRSFSHCLSQEAGPGPGQPGWLPLLGSLGLPGTESTRCLALHEC